MKFSPIEIGNLKINIPIFQGGMGIGVSLSGLAGAVGLNGGVGVISAAQIGFKENNFDKNPVAANLAALKKHIQAAKEQAMGGVIGVNIMTASRLYNEYVKAAVEYGADMIISGAGLPINLPELVKNSKAKVVPIISSLKAAKVLLSLWDKRYGETADAVVIEGPKAGGHLGFKEEEISKPDYESTIPQIIAFIKEQGERFGKKIPVIFGGGVFNKEEADKYMDMGCDGVQISTRFVATKECDAHMDFKKAYVGSNREDICIIQSPVGFPGRALKNNFLETVDETTARIKGCYGCLTHCNAATTPYCISRALIRAAQGDADNGLVFCGSEAWRIDEITTVKDIFDEFTEEESQDCLSGDLAKACCV